MKKKSVHVTSANRSSASTSLSIPLPAPSNPTPKNDREGIQESKRTYAQTYIQSFPQTWGNKRQKGKPTNGRNSLIKHMDEKQNDTNTSFYG